MLPKPAGSSQAGSSRSETVTIPLDPPQGSNPTEQFYEVADGEVTVKMTIGFALFAKYRLTLWDPAGKNPQTIAEGIDNDSLPDEFKIGAGRQLAGKVLAMQIVLASPTGGGTTPVNIHYLLKGGKRDKDFNVKGVHNGDTVTYSLAIRLRA